MWGKAHVLFQSISGKGRDFPRSGNFSDEYGSRKGLHRIEKGASNVDIVVNGISSLLVDAGRKGGSEKILKMMERNGSDPSDIKVIFLTHTHNDHTGSLKTLKKATGADVTVHEAEAQFMRDVFSPFPEMTILITRMIISLARRLLKSVGRSNPQIESRISSIRSQTSILGI